MVAKVVGMQDVIKNLSNLIGDIQSKKAVRAVTKALIIGGTQAALYTPIDTSTLLNSQFRKLTLKDRGYINGKIGYTASYASKVHSPKIKQKFRRASAKKEFLKYGVEDVKDVMDRAVRDEMKV